MLIYHRTSIFESPAQTIVNTVNCVGVMGKGIAAEFRKRYPAMYDEYRKICDKKLLEPGKLWLWKAPDRWVLNFPTKNHWRNPSRLEWIEAGLEKFVKEYDRRGVTEISFPRLGCGNGGLDWSEVRPVMETYLSDLPITIYVHDYEVDMGWPEHLETFDKQAAARVDRSFEDFIRAIQETIVACAGQFRMLETDAIFTVRFVKENHVVFESNNRVTEIDVDDLRSIWVKLLRGVVTAKAAQWDSEVTGEHILAVLSQLRDVRAVQIRRRKSEQPEIAVELRHRRGSQIATDANPGQPVPTWG